MNLGADPESIKAAETVLNCALPPLFKGILMVCNGFECPPDWRITGVWDKMNARRATDNLVYQNTDARWEIMPADLLAIADNGTGNRLVFRKEGECALEKIYVWNHETNKVKPWSKTLADLMAIAQKRVADIERRIISSRNNRA